MNDVSRIAGTMTVALLLTACSGQRSKEVEPKNQQSTIYGDKDIVKGVLFGAGPVAKLFPEVWKDGTALAPTDGETGFVDEIVTRIEQKDPGFSARFATAVQSGSPVRIAAALGQSKDTVNSTVGEDVAGRLIALPCVTITIFIVLDKVITVTKYLYAPNGPDGDLQHDMYVAWIAGRLRHVG